MESTRSCAGRLAQLGLLRRLGLAVAAAAALAGVPQAFAQAGPGQATPLEWVEQLRSEDAGLRGAAMRGLVGAKPPAAGVVAALAQLLDDPNWLTRNIALSVLKGIGPDAKAAFPGIIEALDDENRQVQSTAVLALKSVGAHSRSDRLALVERMTHPNRRTRLVISGVLAKSSAEDVVPELTALCSSEDAEVRRSAIGVLFGLDPAVAGPIALDLLGSDDAAVWRQAASALQSLDPDARAAAVPILARRLDEAQHYGDALSALHKMGPAAEPALPALLRMLERSRTSTPVAPRVVAAIAAVGPPARVALPTFHEMLAEARLDEGSGRHRDALVDAIRALSLPDDSDPPGQPSDPALHAYAVRCAQGLGSADVMTRSASLNALIHLGEDAEPAREALRETLREDPQPKYRQYAARALAAMQGKARPALPDLRLAESDENDRVRKAASDAIAKIETSPVAAIAALPPIEPLPTEDEAQIVVRKYLAGKLEGRRATQKLIEIGPAVSPHLHRALLEDELSERRRVEIIDMLGWLGDARSVEVILQFAHAHPEQPGYWISALQALLRLPHTPAARTAIETVLDDPKSPARHRALAIAWYAEHRDAKGRVWVERHRHDPEPGVRFAALYAAAFLGDSTAAEPLAAMLDDPEYRSDRELILLALVELLGPTEFEAAVHGRKDAPIEAARQMVTYRTASEAERRSSAPRLIHTRDMHLRQLVVRDRIEAGDLASFDALLANWPQVSGAVRATVVTELRRAGYEIAERDRRFVIRKMVTG